MVRPRPKPKKHTDTSSLTGAERYRLHAHQGKKPFEDALEAQQVAKRFRKKYGPKLESYVCSVCGHYHLGHKFTKHRAARLRKIKSGGNNNENTDV